MGLKVLDVSHVQPPCDFTRELIVGKVEFFEGRVEGKNDIFFKGFCGGVFNQVIG
jgi:hypothetical protein